MKKAVTLFFCGVVSLLLTNSCSRFYLRIKEQLVIEDRNWTENMDLIDVSVRPSKSCLDIYAWLGWQSHVSVPLNGFVLDNNITEANFTPAEKFAAEEIRQRSSELKSYFEANIAPATDAYFIMTNVYMRRTPEVYADKVLFGKNPGENLSSFFRYVGGTPFKCTGPDYKVVDTRLPQRFPLVEFFSAGTMMPFMFFLQSTEIPEELSVDDNVNLTFVFPVTIEHYWSWLLEQYNNPNAEESFEDVDMILTANLKDLRAVDPEVEPGPWVIY